MSDNFKSSVSSNRPKRQERVIAMCVFVSVLAFFAVAWSFNAGILNPKALFGICGLKQKYHIPCPTCGMTSSVRSFTYGNFAESFRLQPAGGVLCVSLVCAGVCSFLTVLGADLRFIYSRLASLRFRYVATVVMIVFLAGWAVTMSRALAKL